MKYLVMSLCIMVIGLAGCAGSVQTNTARAILTIHDTVKVSAEAADALCDQKAISEQDCMVMKSAYDAFRAEWPQTSGALKVYLQSEGATGQATFNAHYQEFMGLYQQLYASLLKNGVIKLTEGGK